MNRAMARRWLIVLLVAGVVLMFTAMLLPGAALAWFYNDAHALGRVLIGLDQTAFPDGMGERVYYQPVERGLEIKLKEKLDRLRAAREKALAARK